MYYTLKCDISQSLVVLSSSFSCGLQPKSGSDLLSNPPAIVIIRAYRQPGPCVECPCWECQLYLHIPFVGLISVEIRWVIKSHITLCTSYSLPNLSLTGQRILVILPSRRSLDNCSVFSPKLFQLEFCVYGHCWFPMDIYRFILVKRGKYKLIDNLRRRLISCYSHSPWWGWTRITNFLHSSCFG